MNEEFLKVYIEILNKKIEEYAKNEIIYATKVHISESNVNVLLEQKKIQEEDFQKVYNELVNAREGDNADSIKSLEELKTKYKELQQTCNDIIQERKFEEANLKELHRKEIESIHDKYQNHSDTPLPYDVED